MPIVTFSKKVKMIWGLSLHGWEDLMRVSLIVVGVSGLMAGLSTWFVVKLQRAEIAQTEVDLEKYKEDTKLKVEEAKKEGIEAGKAAGDALLRAAELEKKAAESKERATKLELELAKIKQPRKIGEDRIPLIAERLRPFSGTKFDAAAVPGDAEALIFLTFVAATLESAGWKWVDWNPANGSQVYTITGANKPTIGQFGFFDLLVILHPDHPAELLKPAQELVAALNAEGFAATLEVVANPNIPNKDTVHITVGRKR
jgi:hypothetical protein